MRDALNVVVFCVLYFGVGMLFALVRTARKALLLITTPARMLVAAVLRKESPPARSSDSATMQAPSGIRHS